jgi:hypothetical protein
MGCVNPGPKNDGAGALAAPAPNAPEMGNYFSELLIATKFELILPPRPFTAAMIATAIPAAIRPYSMAVAPDSSLKNDLMIDVMAGSDLVDVRGTEAPLQFLPGNIRGRNLRVP